VGLTSPLAAKYLIRRFLGESSALYRGPCSGEVLRPVTLGPLLGAGGSGFFQGGVDSPRCGPSSGNSGRKGWRADPQHYLIAQAPEASSRPNPAARAAFYRDYLLVTIFTQFTNS
jgi:hypothetical protein